MSFHKSQGFYLSTPVIYKRASKLDRIELVHDGFCLRQPRPSLLSCERDRPKLKEALIAAGLLK